jgi:hypothetical protein
VDKFVAEDNRPARGWYSRAEICEFHDVTEQTFDRTYRPLIPDSGIQKVGNRVWYHGGAYLESVIAYKVKVATKRDGGGPGSAGGDDVGALGAVDKEAAQRLLRAKAQEQELKVGQMLNNLVPIQELMAEFSAFGKDLRRVGEMQQRQFGADAAAMINELLDEYEKRWGKGGGGLRGGDGR